MPGHEPRQGQPLRQLRRQARPLPARVRPVLPDLVAEASADLSGPGPAYQRLLDHIRAVAKSIVADRKRVGCLLAKGSAELSGTDADVADRALAAFTELRAVLADCIAAAQREGDLAADADPDRLANLVLAVLRGMEALGKAGAEAEWVHAAAEQAIALLPR